VDEIESRRKLKMTLKNEEMLRTEAEVPDFREEDLLRQGLHTLLER